MLGIDEELRTNATEYTAAWKQYVTEVSEIIRRNLITEEGGVVIAVQVENEVSRAGLWLRSTEKAD